MDKLAVAEAAASGRSRGPIARLGPHAARLKAASASWNSTTAPRIGNIQVDRRRIAGQLRERDQAAHRRLQRHRGRPCEGVARPKGRQTEVQATRDHRTRHGPTPRPTRCKRSGTRSSFCDDRPPAPAHQHLRGRRPGAELRLPFDPRLLPGGGLSLHPHADHHGQRLRRRRRDVPGHHARLGAGPQARGRKVDYTRTSSTGRPI